MTALSRAKNAMVAATGAMAEGAMGATVEGATEAMVEGATEAFAILAVMTVIADGAVEAIAGETATVLQRRGGRGTR